ncbi:MAG: hypothetical protein J6U54_02430 [Clostridiales bacterium]|nr:hypothetical protein [Clostridiales bacterium]
MGILSTSKNNALYDPTAHRVVGILLSCSDASLFGMTIDQKKATCNDECPVGTV